MYQCAWKSELPNNLLWILLSESSSKFVGQFISQKAHYSINPLALEMDI